MKLELRVLLDYLLWLFYPKVTFRILNTERLDTGDMLILVNQFTIDDESKEKYLNFIDIKIKNNNGRYELMFIANQL